MKVKYLNARIAYRQEEFDFKICGKRLKFNISMSANMAIAIP